ncbi:RWD domain-containing protein 2B [Stigmatopora nigra]
MEASLSMSVFRERAEAQLAELDLLASMFPTELEIVDQLALAELRNQVEVEAEGQTSSSSSSSSAEQLPSSRPHFVINLRLDDDRRAAEGIDFILSCTYPPDYPGVLPELTVRCGQLTRAQRPRLHSDLRAHLARACPGEPCVLPAVEWLRDNLGDLVRASSAAAVAAVAAAPPGDNDHDGEEAFARLWIYSHHIYNASKRKNILEWAQELRLSGFSMPGKPGVVCVEGARDDCEDFWARVKCLTWKRITVRHREDVSLRRGSDADSFRKFDAFREALFDGGRGKRGDLGSLYRFLQEKDCHHVFQAYFGLEGQR